MRKYIRFFGLVLFAATVSGSQAMADVNQDDEKLKEPRIAPSDTFASTQACLVCTQAHSAISMDSPYAND